MTPRQLNALFRHRERQRDYEREHSEYMAAQIVAMVANTGFRAFEKAREPREFMPSEWIKASPKTTKSTARRMTKQRRQAVSDKLRVMFPRM